MSVTGYFTSMTLLGTIGGDTLVISIEPDKKCLVVWTNQNDESVRALLGQIAPGLTAVPDTYQAKTKFARGSLAGIDKQLRETMPDAVVLGYTTWWYGTEHEDGPVFAFNIEPHSDYRIVHIDWYNDSWHDHPDVTARYIDQLRGSELSEDDHDSVCLNEAGRCITVHLTEQAAAYPKPTFLMLFELFLNM